MKKTHIFRCFLCFLAAVISAVTLSGCELFTVDTAGLLSPPEPGGDMYPIQKALTKSVKGDYNLKYPSSGDRRSAFILEDIDADNSFEAFAFYSTVIDETTYMNVNFIVSEDGKWHSAGAQSIVAGGVETVDFCDLDDDGISELIVGWEIFSTTEKQLAVYSCNSDGISQRMLKQYTSFMCCDLDENDEFEVFIHLLDATGGVNTASLVTIGDDGTTEIAGCLMDKTVKSASKPIVSTLSSGKPAIYIDEIKGAGAVTEVLFFSQGALVNPLLDISTTENTKTLRLSSVFSKDINRDDIIEIPVASELPSAMNLENAEKFYYTKWCSFNGEQLTEKQLTIMNPADGYYLDVPSKWSGNIAMSRNTDDHSRIVYAYDNVGLNVGEPIAYFRVVSQTEWDEGEFSDLLCTEICRKGEKVFIGRAEVSSSPVSVTDDELKSILRLIE